MKIMLWGVFRRDTGKLACWAGGKTPAILSARSQYAEYGWNTDDFVLKRIEAHT